MKRLVIRARAVATGGRPLEDKLVVLSGKKIESILPSTAAKRISSQNFVGSSRYLVFPGLIDLHSHGGGGVDPQTLGGLLAAAYYHASHGTTAWMLTVLYRGPEELAHMAELVKRARPQASLHLLGLHLEGPFLNPEARGAIPAECIQAPSAAAVEQILRAGGDELRTVTVAPEMPGAEAVIRRLTAAGVTVALGHSLADAGQAKAGADWGARLVTHLGNAMRPFHQRESGLVGVGLGDARLTVEVIADGYHLAPETLSLFLRGKQGDVVAVSDCRWVAGLPEGSRSGSGGETLEVRDGTARNAAGGLAGGVHPLWMAMITIAALPGFSVWDASRVAALNPAKFMGLRNFGKISAGGRADLVLAGPDFSIQRVFYHGDEIYRAAGEPSLPE